MNAQKMEITALQIEAKHMRLIYSESKYWATTGLLE